LGAVQKKGKHIYRFEKNKAAGMAAEKHSMAIFCSREKNF
jgi:hypothetical protein